MSSDLKKLHKDPVGCVWDPTDGPGVLHVRNGHALIKASGYLKFTRGQTRNVLFRGQRQIYNSLLPSLYRSVKKEGTRHRMDKVVNQFCRTSADAEAFLRGTPEYAFEPLLQHYGVRTRWLDVVDNVWIALWFAAHKAIGFGATGESLHFEKRRQDHHAIEEYCYILMIETPGKGCTETETGLYKDADLTAIDLRKAVPSIYLRPHSQHGLLIRKKTIASLSHLDLMPFVAGIIRVGLQDALEWLGTSTLLSVHTLFPPPLYDQGYARLLQKCPDGDQYVLSVAYVAP